MKRNDITLLAVVAIVAGLISFLIAGAVFNNSKSRSIKVPTVEALPSNFPDVKNDASYQSFLNDKALDAIQPVQIGNTKNGTPFNSQR